MARPRKHAGALVILLSRFAYFCTDVGLVKSLGVLIPGLAEQLQTSNAILGLVTSLSLAAMQLGSPIAKVLLSRCTNQRLLTSTCGLAAGCALIGTAFTRNILGLCLFFLSMGFLCSVINMQAIVLLFDYYQEEYFPLASCLSVLGIPVGAALLPPLTEKLLDEYGISGSLLIIGALSLNLWPIGLLLKARRKSPVIERSENERLTVNESAGRSGDITDNACSSITSAFSREENRHASRKNTTANLQMDASRTNAKSKGTSKNKLSSTLNDHQGQPLHEDALRQCSSTSQESISRRVFVGDEINLASNDNITGTLGKILTPAITTSKETESSDVSCRMGGQDSPAFTSQNTEGHIRSTSEKRESLPWRILRAFLMFIHIDVLIKEPSFATFFLTSIILLFTATGGWALFIVLYAVEHGIDIARGAYLATTGAVGGIVSSILMSIALWYRPNWSPRLYLGNLILSAACFILQTLHSSYAYLVLMSFLIGFGLFGANVTCEAVMSSSVSKSNFVDASSLLLFSVGIGYLLSGYMAGFVRDQTGDMKLVFLYLGSTMAASSLLVVALMICLRHRLPVDSKNAED